MRKTQEEYSLVYMLAPILLGLISFVAYTNNAEQIGADEWLRAKKASIISCGIGGSSNGAGSGRQLNEPVKDKCPEGNGNPCSHQATTGCSISESKRRSVKLFPC